MVGTQRIHEIFYKLKLFSFCDIAVKIAFNIHFYNELLTLTGQGLGIYLRTILKFKQVSEITIGNGAKLCKPLYQTLFPS